MGDGGGTSSRGVVGRTFLSAREWYARELASRRRQSGLTLVELAKLCLYEQSYLHRLERGQRLGTVEAAAALDRVYGTGDLLVRLWHLARRETKDRLLPGIEPLEREAVSIQEYAVAAVPDLLQTRAYAREQLQTAHVGEERLAAEVSGRIDRQERLTGRDPLHYRALIDEAVLRRGARDPKTWAGQLEHLVEAAQRPGVCVQVVPFGSGPHPIRACLELVYFRDAPTVAYTQGSWSGHLTEDPEEVEPLRLAYDVLRDTALTPAESLAFLRALREEQAAPGPSQGPES
ncbi:putative DNA-binding protein [Actinacidiphila reveromycinica]|uniref:Putative DNA-binding protein n=1 Tax=Actinacidiphila reveromycinica TaxID=659352 RepID=A0A7U3UNA5_9ACTN|nr:helix-turn-helix transcriptional regulator [Streptomyces sp. SN-593]BBA95737.1 putative DNA-binding protein [Streptomyces sp. SN-593]